MAMSPTGPVSKNDCAGEDQRQFTLPDPLKVINPEDDNRKYCRNYRKPAIFDAV
jgi:hypothetical protein